MSFVPNKTLLRIWKALPPQLGAVVGEEAKLSDPDIAREWSPGGKRYYAELALVEPRAATLWMSFAMPLAIASAGHLVMRPKNAIRSNIDAGKFDGDDLDAMGECVNTFCAALNEAVRASLGEDHRIVFRTGSLEPPDTSASGELSVARGHLELGTLASGEVELVVPDRVFVLAHEGGEGEDEPEAADDDDGGDDDEDHEDPSDEAPERPEGRASASKGRRRRKYAADFSGDAPLLSAEELAAIREATAAMVEGVVLVVADRASAREQWRELLTGKGVECELVANHHQVLAMCRARNVEVVVVDADASSSGGLALLAAIRGGIGVPKRRVVVASLATHTHLVACFAGGATAYVTRPLEDGELERVLSPS